MKYYTSPLQCWWDLKTTVSTILLSEWHEGGSLWYDEVLSTCSENTAHVVDTYILRCLKEAEAASSYKDIQSCLAEAVAYVCMLLSQTWDIQAALAVKKEKKARVWWRVLSRELFGR